MLYGLGDYQGGLEAGQEAVNLYRQLDDQFGLGCALCYTGNMAAFQNQLDLAEQALSEAIQIGHEIGNNLILCFALGVFSHYVALPRGDIATARTYAEESAHYAREIGMSWAEAQGEVVLARISMILGQLDEARQHALKAAAVFQDLRDPVTLNLAYNELADIELRARNLEAARNYLKECILTGKELNLRAFVAQALESYAYIAQAQNQPARAARLLGAAEAVQEGLGTSAIGVHRLEQEYESAVAWLHAQLTETAYDAHWSEGCAMSMDKAISYALEE
jgi:tetratricopeptide (TPR) repeat protein